MPALTLRSSTVADADRLGRAVIAGFAGFRSFAPAGWEPPSVDAEISRLRELLADPQVWSLLAESGGQLVGQATMLPATRAARPVEDATLAHLRNLFVDADHWGTGLATRLHGAAIDAARERGYAAMRLFTPTAQRRARRFYEREGWIQAGEAFHDAGPDLVLVEYRLTLRA